MFGRKQKTTADPAVDTEGDIKPGGKGRPTPTRKEAEAARKATLKVPSDPKAAKKAMRERERAERNAQRQALASGDERALPARDAGPLRGLIRDTVDSRRSVGEIFIPVAILVLITGFLRNSVIVTVTYYVWLVMLALVLADVVWIVIKLRKKVAQELPDTPVKVGDYLYGVMRSLTLRRLRLPPPKFRAGGKPVEPKVKKNAKTKAEAN